MRNLKTIVLAATLTVLTSGSAAIAANEGPHAPVDVDDIYRPELLKTADALLSRLNDAKAPEEKRALLLQISALDFAAEKYKSAESFLRRIQAECPPASEIEQAKIYFHLGTVANAAKNYRAAEDALRKAEDILKAQSRAMHGIAPTVSGPDPTASGPAPTVSGPDPTASGPAPTVSGPDPTVSGPALTESDPAATGPALTVSDPALEFRVIDRLCACLSRRPGTETEVAKLLERAVDLSYKMKNRLFIGWTQLSLSDSYRAIGDKERAESFFDKAMMSFKRELENAESAVAEPDSTDLWEALEAGPQRAPAHIWKAAGKPMAVVLCVHGLGLHSGYYKCLGETLQKRNITTVAIDVRGFGAWASMAGKEQVDIEQAVHDVSSAAKFLRKLNPGVPVFLLGESMGGAIVLRTAGLYPDIVDGVISSVPAADRYNTLETAGKVAWHMLVKGNKEFNVGPAVIKRVTEKEELRLQWENDRFAKLKLPPHEIISFDKFMKQNVQAAQIMDKPALLTQGEQDQLVKPNSTIALFRAIKTHDKNLVLLGSAEHLIFEAGQFNPVLIDALCAWIAAHGSR